MNGEMLDLVRRKLEASALDDAERQLVLAACVGPEALERCVAGEGIGAPAAAADGGALAPIWLASVVVEGFRGVAGRAELALEPRPGLVLVTGRNGSGKSSFAEGLETVLRGTSRRWEDRPADFADGWRNVHHDGAAAVTATFLRESGEQLELGLRWTGDDVAKAERTGASPEVWEAVRSGVGAYSPLLAYGDLARRLESEPMDLYLTMTAALGVDEIEGAWKRLGRVRKELTDRVGETERARKALAADLARLDDPRAARAREGLAAGEVDFAALEALVEDRGEPSADAAEARRLAALAVPDERAVGAAVDAVRQARAHLADATASAAARASRLAALLESALAWHLPGEAAPCPLCREGVLDDGFRARAERERVEAEALARSFTAARAAVEAAEAALRALAGKVPREDLAAAARLGLCAAPALEVVRAWIGRASAADADGVAAAWPEARRALEGIRDAARAWLTEREDRWRPLRLRLAAWLADGRAAAGRKALAERVRAAEKWLKETEQVLGNERFAPIASDVARLFGILAQGSHVSLEGVRLTGQDRRRKVEMVAKLDGAEGAAAVGVMSQGELNALALALFVPRATLPDSPFRFVVLDDPVQALDPAKVDGLARVLGELAERRQVVVLTHDTRLREALRRLKIPARVLEVVRRERSRVRVREVQAPEEQFLSEASEVLASALSPELVAVTVPTLCRCALEVVLVEAAWRKGLDDGRTHDDVAEQIARSRGTRALAALALFGERRRGDEVDGWFRRELGPEAAEVYATCNTAGGHGTRPGDPERLVARTRELVRALAGRLA